MCLVVSPSVPRVQMTQALSKIVEDHYRPENISVDEVDFHKINETHLLLEQSQ